jgi:hypothetical protein
MHQVEKDLARKQVKKFLRGGMFVIKVLILYFAVMVGVSKLLGLW